MVSLAVRRKTGAVASLAIDRMAQESEAGREFFNLFNQSDNAALAVYQRAGNQFVVTDIMEPDEEARLIAAHVFSIPVQRLADAVDRSSTKE